MYIHRQRNTHTHIYFGGNIFYNRRKKGTGKEIGAILGNFFIIYIVTA